MILRPLTIYWKFQKQVSDILKIISKNHHFLIDFTDRCVIVKLQKPLTTRNRGGQNGGRKNAMKIEMTKEEAKALYDALLWTRHFRENIVKDEPIVQKVNKTVAKIETRLFNIAYGPDEKFPIREGSLTELETVDLLLEKGTEETLVENQGEVLARALLAYKGVLFLGDAILLSKCQVKDKAQEIECQ